MAFETTSHRRSRLAGRADAATGRLTRRGLRLAGAALLLSLAAGCQQLPDVDLPLLGAAKSPAPGPSEPAAAPIAGEEMVRRAQSGLAALGYRPGPADGKAGPRTRRAVSAFQRDSGLPADGRVTQVLLGWIEAALERSKQTAEPAEKTSREEPPKHSRVALDRSRLPRYRRGSTYVYSDGRIERLTGIRGETLRWTGTDGRLSTGYRNFLLPPAHWKNGDEEGTAELSVDAGNLWPLASDAPKRFVAEVAQRGGAGDSSLTKYRETWTCRLAGKARAVVPAGRFATVKFVCARAATESRPTLERAWYYAPDIGHYVRRGEGAKAARSRVELVAILPSAADWPPIARAALDRAVQDALDEAADGKARTWSSSGLDTAVVITPTRSYKDARGRTCRSYIQTWKRGKSHERYPATACRDAAGRWIIPGLEGAPQDSIAISQR